MHLHSNQQKTEPLRHTCKGWAPLFTALLFAIVLLPAKITQAETAPSATTREIKSIVAVFPKYFPPYYLTGEDNVPTGFAIDVLNVVAKRADLKVTYVPKRSWDEASEAIQRKEADVIPSMGITEDRRAFLLFTAPVDTFSIMGFARKGFDQIETINEISGKVVGVVETNAAERILENRSDIKLARFKDFPAALVALLTGEVDVFFYPERPIWKTADEGQISNRIRAIGPPLLRVDRAIALRKDLPNLRRILDRELRAFQGTDEFENLYRKWHGPRLKEDTVLSTYLIAAAVAIVLLLGASFLYWSRRGKSGETVHGIFDYAMRTQFSIKERFAGLSAVLTIVVLIVATTAIWILYSTAFKEEKTRLLEMARSHARLIERMAQFDRKYSLDFPGGYVEATFKKIREGTSPRSGTTEFAIARRNGDNIEYIVRQLASRSYQPRPIPFSGQRGEPMERALSGMSGTVVAPDYRGEWVLAAYEPVGVLDLGVVVKKDMSEIRAPFIRAGVFSFLIAILAIVAGVSIFIRLSNPLLTGLVNSEKRLRSILEASPIPLLITEYPASRILYGNPASEKLFGGPLKEFIGRQALDFYIDPDVRRVVIDGLNRDGEVRNLETPVRNLAGDDIWITVNSKLVEFEGTQALVSGLANIDERKKMEMSLRKGEELLRLTTEMADIAVWEYDLKSNRMTRSRNHDQLYGLVRQEIWDINTFLQATHPDDREPYQKIIMASVAPGGQDDYTFEFRTVWPDGDTHWLWVKGRVIERDQTGQGILVRGALLDVTEQKLTAAMLRQSQKLEAVGQLTGGIAHDFNNILGIILGNLDLLRREIPNQPEALELVDEAHHGAERGADITRKLLSFSRTEGGNPQLTNVNEFIKGMENLVAKTLTPIIKIETHLADDIWPVRIDPGEFENVFLNLALNAKDAMPDGGSLIVGTYNKVIDDMYVHMNPGSKAGDHVLVSVSDTGTGMTPEIIEKIFQPFFTTKSAGRGTGLGLSLVYGFVKRSGGHIKVYSESGKGTTFNIYFPRETDETSGRSVDDRVIASEPPRGTESILIVDDEEGLLKVAVSYLEDLGYRTQTATSGKDALALLEKSDQIDLLFSDVVMPGGMDGYNLAKEVLRNHPGVKVLLTSGFTSRREGALNGDRAVFARLSKGLLNKPYNRTELASAIRRALDGENG